MATLREEKRGRLRERNERRKEKERDLRVRTRERQKLMRERSKNKEKVENQKEQRQLKRQIKRAKPKRSIGPYAMFVKSKFPEIKNANPSKKTVEIFKEVAQMWKDVSAEEKQKLVDASKENRAQYLKARTHFFSEFPKKATAFNFFMKDQYKGVKENSPSGGLGQIAQQVSEMWRNASPDVKEKYQRMSQSVMNKRHHFVEKLKAK